MISFVRLTERLEHFHFQSTGLISSDVPEQVADAYRLFLSLCLGLEASCDRHIRHWELWADVRHALNGPRRDELLKQKPLAIFDACPSPPLTWTNLTTQSLMDCARAGVPSELVAMPLTGATAPATLAGRSSN